MDSPFFFLANVIDSLFLRNYYYAPNSSYYAYPSPAHSTMPTRRPAPRSAHTQPSARVASKPIHFVGSERLRSKAAVRIQKALRGFLVRRAVKKIRAVWAEEGALERRVEDGGMANGLRRDERERVRVNDLLMGLLFRLDSVPGVDSAVRDCRKKVIRRVVALQERVDALVQEVNDSETRDSTDSDRNHDSVLEEKVDPNQTMEARDHNSDSILEDATTEADQTVHVDQTIKGFDDDQAMEIRDSSDSTLEDPAVKLEQIVDLNAAVGERGNKCVDERDLKEALEKMMEENKKLKRLISELCEEVSQNRVVNSLSHRVEALEKAVSKRRKTMKANPCNARKGRYDL